MVILLGKSWLVRFALTIVVNCNVIARLICLVMCSVMLSVVQ